MFETTPQNQSKCKHREPCLRAKAIDRPRFTWRDTDIVKFVVLTFLITCLPGARAQQGDSGRTTLRARSNLVMVPVLVTTKRGQIVFGLTADDFHLTDDGVQQHLVVEQDTDAQPLALAIVVQTGGEGARHLDDYRGRDAILDTLIGSVDHRVAVIGFDSSPHVIMPFTLNTEQASQRLGNLTAGNQGAAILDAVVFAVGQLREEPPRYRRVILLLSETVDQGSKTNLSDATSGERHEYQCL